MSGSRSAFSARASWLCLSSSTSGFASLGAPEQESVVEKTSSQRDMNCL